MAAGLPTFLGVNLVTPKGVVAHTDTDSLQAPGELGEFELLPGHVPMLTALMPGVLTIGTKTPARYAISSGYLRIDPQGAVLAVKAVMVDVMTQLPSPGTRRPRPSLTTGSSRARRL